MQVIISSFSDFFSHHLSVGEKEQLNFNLDTGENMQNLKLETLLIHKTNKSGLSENVPL